MNRNVVSPSRVPVWPYVWNMTKKMDMDSNPIWWIWSIPLVMWISPLKSSDIERSLGMLEWSECGKSDGFPAICCQPKELWSIKVGKFMEIFGTRSMGDGHQAVLVFDGHCTSTYFYWFTPAIRMPDSFSQRLTIPILSPCLAICVHATNARWQLHFESPTVPSLWLIALKVVLCRQRRCCDKPFKKGWSHVCLQTALDFRNDLWVYVINSLRFMDIHFNT